MKLGFIGLGIMGVGMANNLLRLGYPLTVYNRTKAKAEPLLAKGATWANTPSELAKKVDILVTMLGDPKAVSACAEGPDGFLDSLQPGSIWIDSSTVNLSFSRQMAQESKRRQITFVDAPVIGSRGPAERGELTFFVGAKPEVLEKCRPLFEVMGKKIVLVGDTGSGVSIKLCMNLMVGEAMIGFAEALHLGQAMGLNLDLLLSTITETPMIAPVLSTKRNKIANDAFDEIDFPLHWMRKDLQMASQTGYELSTPLPMVNTAKEIYALAEKAGLSEKDFSSIYKLFLESVSGSE